MKSGAGFFLLVSGINHSVNWIPVILFYKGFYLVKLSLSSFFLCHNSVLFRLQRFD